MYTHEYIHRHQAENKLFISSKICSEFIQQQKIERGENVLATICKANRKAV